MVIEARHEEYKLVIKGPSIFDLTNHLATLGWVFSSVVQEGFFSGFAIGYNAIADPRSFEGYAISTDQTRVDHLEPVYE